MKIAITSAGENLESPVDSRFGRCRYFIVYDTENENIMCIENVSTDVTGGAGVQAAQLLINSGVEVVITGNIGPNAYTTLSAGGIKIYKSQAETVKRSLDMFNKGQLEEHSNSSVPPHFGMK